MKELVFRCSKIIHDVNCNFHWRRQIKDIRRQADIKIKSLSPEQRREIKYFYAQYGFRNIRMDWHDYIYAVTGKYSPTFLPEDFFHRVIEDGYNDRKLYRAWENKAYMPQILSNVTFPETIITNCNGYFFNKNNEMISEECAKQLVMECGDSFAKPTMASGGGRGAIIIGVEDPSQAFAHLEKDFIVQRKIVQSPETAAFNPSSVNTIKVVSMLFKGEVFILSSIMRVGAENSITDAAASGKGYFFGIDKNGTAIDDGISIYGKKRTIDYYGQAIKGRRISQYSEVCEIVKLNHKKFPYFGIMSWDFCVNDKNEVLLIEYNTGYPVALVYQMVNGPLLGEITDQVLRDISQK